MQPMKFMEIQTWEYIRAGGVSVSIAVVPDHGIAAKYNVPVKGKEVFNVKTYQAEGYIQGFTA
jgi:hypothetical protein